MKLPDEFVAKHKATVEGATCFGIPLSELSSDELLAVIGHCQEESQRDKASRDGLLGMFKAVVSKDRHGNEVL